MTFTCLGRHLGGPRTGLVGAGSGALLAFVWAARIIWRHWQAHAPIRAAKMLLASVFADGNADADAVNACNELLKRVLVAALDMQPLGKLSGDDWLRALDSISQSQNFSQGPGRALGTARFAPDQPVARRSCTKPWKACSNNCSREIRPRPRPQFAPRKGGGRMIEWLWPYAFFALPLPWLVRRFVGKRDTGTGVGRAISGRFCVC